MKARDTPICPLFVPANRPDRFAKAAASGADAIIVDLEDAVAPDDKPGARGALERLRDIAGPPAFVRINGPATPWHDDDVAALVRIGWRHVVLPKVETADEVERVGARLGSEIQVMAQIESARGVEQAAAIAGHPAVDILAYGPADFFAEMGMSPSAAMSGHVLLRLALASRAAGKALPLDGPCFSIGDAAVLDAECAAARAQGAGGKLCIHPAQVATVLAAFGPSDEEIAWARRVVAADADGRAQVVDGRMIDAPIAARARSLLRRAGR